MKLACLQLDGYHSKRMLSNTSLKNKVILAMRIEAHRQIIRLIKIVKIARRVIVFFQN